MDEKKKERASKARTLSRRTTELFNAVRHDVSVIEVNEKIDKVKYTFEELGGIQDEVIDLLDENDVEGHATEMKWYEVYDHKVNIEVAAARRYLDNVQKKDEAELPVKISKLTIPVFESQPRKYLRWKSTFERYTKGFNDDIKYDYLLANTKGKANDLVANRSSFQEALEKLDKEYGNKHTIMSLLIDEIKSLPIVRRGDFRGFERLSYEANAFRDRLQEMGYAAEAENTYILKELESKLNTDDLHRWLESMGETVDTRKVKHLVRWLEHQTNLRRISSHTSQRTGNSQGQMNLSFEKYKRFSNVSSAQQNTNCEICVDESHEVQSCPKFISWDLNEKWNYAKQQRLCFQCLQRDHRRENCKAPRCQYCNRFHHSILHNRVRFDDFHENLQADQGDVTRFNNVANFTDASILAKSGIEVNERSSPVRCFLPIVKSTLINGEKKVRAVTILDTGSELNIINTKLCNKLCLVGPLITINIVGVSGEIFQKQTKMVDLLIEDRMGYRTPLQCIVLDKICGSALKVNQNVFSLFPNSITIPKNEIFVDGGEIDLLLGMSCPRLHQQISIYGQSNGLMIMETRFGPTLVGRVPDNCHGNYECGVFNLCRLSICDEEDNLLKIVEAETAGIQKECSCQLKTDEELLFDNCMKDAWAIDDTGRFEVKLPWKIDPSNLKNNRVQALNRSYALEKKLSKIPDVKKLFDEQIEEMITQGVLQKTEPSYPKRYIPLLAIVNLERESTKVRVCLDSKSKFAGLSLNDALLKGKYEMNDIFQVITMFRAGKYTLVGDIRKMFWQIRITNSDQKYHGVIFKGETFVFTRICFGNKPSPPIAELSMIKIAQYGREMYPKATEALLFKRYMDDILDSNSDVEMLKKSRDEIDQLLGKFGFEVKEWFSNHHCLGSTTEGKKILGVKYNVSNDELHAVVHSTNREIKLTRRRVLSRIAEIWDPTGLCAGVLLTGKLLFQSITRLNFNWDNVINDLELNHAWNKWNDEIEKCENVIVSRSILPTENAMKQPLQCEVIGFSDGSGVGYGCVVYLRWMNSNGLIVDVKFLGAKGKVAAIKGNTTPRNELCGTLILTRLAWSALEALKKTEAKFKFSKPDVILNSDSTTVLSWIRSPAVKFKPYVKNKIIEIQTLLPSSIWRYVPSKKNKSADLLSKGCTRNELDVIINGPDILWTPNQEWPEAPNEEKKNEEEEIVFESRVAVATVSEPLLDLERYSSWKRLLRVTALVFRFINRIRKKRNLEEKVDNYYGILSKEEISEAENYWLRHAQQEFKIDKKVTEKFVPFEDEHGIKRLTGRLRHSDLLDIEAKHPILLPKKSHVSFLILSDIHERLCHPGHNRVIAASRRKFWIINARRIAKNIGFKCTTCRRWRGEALNQLMSDLPDVRMHYESAPFENAAVDYFGPFQLKFGRKQRIKAYGVVFTCLSTRAIHVDLATDLTTDTFLLALRRFISLYGQPRTMRSDNGRNFRGAAREIAEMIKRWRTKQTDIEKMKDFLQNYEIKWTFSTPLASHHNGAVESLIKSVKYALNNMVNGRVLTEEEYRTVLMQISSLINSRPLWPSNDGDIDDPPITCNDLLRPKGLNRDPSVLNEGNPKTRYDAIQTIVKEWWKAWLRNFVPNLQIRSKWWKSRENVEIGDIVLLIDPDIRRGKWQMGKIIDVFPGRDTKVRSVKVKTSTGTYDRPITKLSLLLSKKEYESNK